MGRHRKYDFTSISDKDLSVRGVKINGFPGGAIKNERMRRGIKLNSAGRPGKYSFSNILDGEFLKPGLNRILGASYSVVHKERKRRGLKRRRGYDLERRKRILDMLEEGKSQTAIAVTEGVSRQRINQIIKKHLSENT